MAFFFRASMSGSRLHRERHTAWSPRCSVGCEAFLVDDTTRLTGRNFTAARNHFAEDVTNFSADAFDQAVEDRSANDEIASSDRSVSS